MLPPPLRATLSEMPMPLLSGIATVISLQPSGSGMHTLGPSGGFMQLKPSSMPQLDEQPSPLAVLPSSHCSPLSTAPLPHSIRVQTLGPTGGLVQV